MIDYLNANINLTFVDTWGYRINGTNNWSGMIGHLVNGKADIGVSALFFTIDRVSIIQYIHMPASTQLSFIFRAPKLSYTDNLYLLPFDGLVWVCLVSLMMVISCVLTFVTIVEWKVQLKDKVSVYMN